MTLGKIEGIIMEDEQFELDWPTIDKIGGWLAKEEARVLYIIASEVTGPIVEIGAWKGRSTATLGFASRNNPAHPLIYTVDPFTGSKEHRELDPHCNTWDEFRENIESLHMFDIVRPYQMTSKEAYEKHFGAIGMLFIDGSHEYEDVKYDFVHWGSNVVKGGWICMHDYYWSGPNRVAKELVMDNPRYRVPPATWGDLFPIQVVS